MAINLIDPKSIREIITEVLQTEGCSKAIKKTDQLESISDKNEAISWIFWQEVQAKKWQDLLKAIHEMPENCPKGQIDKNRLSAALSKQAAENLDKQTAIAAALLILNSEERRRALDRVPKYLAKVGAWDEAIELAASSTDREQILYWLACTATRKQKREKALLAWGKISIPEIRHKALSRIINLDCQNKKWQEAISDAQLLAFPKQQHAMLGRIYVVANKAKAFNEAAQVKRIFCSLGEKDWLSWIVTQELAERKLWSEAIQEAREVSDKKLFSFNWLIELIIQALAWELALQGSKLLLPPEKQDESFQYILRRATNVQSWDAAFQAASSLSKIADRDEAFSFLSRRLTVRKQHEKASAVIEKISNSRIRNEAKAFAQCYPSYGCLATPRKV